MADEQLGSEQDNVTSRLRFRRVKVDAVPNADHFRYFIWLHREGLGVDTYVAHEDDATLWKYIDWFLTVVERNPPPQTRVAFIGGGTCFLPRLFNARTWGALDIYERRQTIINKATQEFPQHATRWNFIQGDYENTLTGTYHLIVYDIPGAANETLLNEHLAPNGMILGV